MRSLGITLFAFVLSVLPGSLDAQTKVTLNPTASPATGDPVVTNITVTGRGFPTGTISPASVTVTLNPATAGTGPSGTTPAGAVTVVSGTTERVTFRIPKAIAVAAATPYEISIAGTTETGNTFVSSNTAALTVNPILAITTVSPLPAGTVNANYSQNLAATGGSGSYTWAVSAGALPAGLSLNTATGLIGGIPTTAGPSSFTIKVTDSIAGAAGKAFSLAINPALTIITNSPLPTGTVNVSYSQTLAATGGSGSYTWSVSAGTLPGGLVLSPAGVISGVPTTATTANFTILVTDTNQATATKAFAMTINTALVITTTSPLPTGQIGVNYSDTLTATGGSGQYTWTVSVGTLPGGLALSAAGVISGVPTTATTANFTVLVTDTNQATASMAFALTINPAATLLTVSPNTGNAGLTLQVAITGSFTQFVQGTTQASFGAGISVGGGAVGQAGPVTVTSPTSATARISISATAVAESQTVTVTTGTQQVTLPNGFTVATAIPFITLTTSSSTPIATGFSGFNDSYLLHGAEWTDPKFLAVVTPLKPGFIRYPGGFISSAFEWQTAHENQSWIAELQPDITTTQLGALDESQMLTQAKGGACFTSTPPGTCFSDYSTFLQDIGANGLVCFNGFTDTDPDSAGIMVGAAQTAGINMIEWELSNEPYGFPLIFPTAASYASAQYDPYYQNIIAANPAATTGVFYQGEFSSFNAKGYMTWDKGMAAYLPQYWTAISTHIYPVTSETLTPTQEEEQLNGILAYATTDYINSYFVPLIGTDTPIYITELNSDAYGTLAFESYIYNGIFLAEYIARMSTSPYVKGVAVDPLYLGNSYNQGTIRAVDDYETYLLNQVRANPNYSTNTATNPNTQFQFYYSANACALEVANLAINSSNGIWPTAMYGAIPTVPITGYGGEPIPAVFAQGYQGINGTNYLLITNKSNQSIPFAVEVNGTLLEQSLTVTYVSSTSDVAQNTATDQNAVQVLTATSTNPITVGPYSVTAVQW